MKPLKIITLQFLLLVTSIVYAQDISFNTFTISEDLKKDANSIIRSESLFVNIKSQTSMTLNVKRAVTVLNNQGDKFRYVVVNYDKNTKITKLKTTIYNAFGGVLKKVKSKEFKDISNYDGFSLYSDNRLKYFEYIPIQYPYTIYYEYEIATVNTGFIPTWTPFDRFETSVEKSEYKVVSQNDMKLRTKEFNFEGYNISKTVNDYAINYSLTNQPSIKHETLSPGINTYTPKLMVGLYKFCLEGIKGEAENWEEFGKWRYDFLKNGNDIVDEGIKARVEGLVAGVDDNLEKARIIYDYVQGKTRYISVQEGIGGWKPANANTVDQLGYGDCKGLTNYTKALLDAVGVESYYSVIWAGKTKKSVDKDFFSMQGNHIILNLPTDKEDIWLECTSQDVAFGELGDFTDDRDVLVITPKGGVIKHTKKYKPLESQQTTVGNYKINDNGSIEAKVEISSKGIQYDDHLGWFLGKTQKDLDIEFKDYFSHINNIEFSKIDISNNKKKAVFEENLEFKAQDYASKSGDQMFIPLNAFTNSTYVPKRVRNRKLPFKISRGYFDVDMVDVQLPRGFKVEYIPSSIELESDFGVYKIEVEKVNELEYKYSRKLTIYDGEYTKDQFDAYRDFRKKIRKYDNRKIIITK